MKALLLFLLTSASCTAYSVSPPLNSRLSEEVRGFNGVYLSSGTFARPHTVIGVLQMTQEGYKLFHEVEVVGDANPGSILYKIGSFAASKGAHGIQNLELVDQKPMSEYDKRAKQVDDMQNGEAGGSKTRWEVRGEMVVFQ